VTGRKNEQSQQMHACIIKTIDSRENRIRKGKIAVQEFTLLNPAEYRVTESMQHALKKEAKYPSRT
jgi:hypothetical protein